MNKDMAEGAWTEIKGKIKSKWNKFTDSEVDVFKGDMQQIVGKIQQAYGYASEHAHKEFNEFMGSINRKIEHKIDGEAKVDGELEQKKV